MSQLVQETRHTVRLLEPRSAMLEDLASFIPDRVGIAQAARLCEE